METEKEFKEFLKKLQTKSKKHRTKFTRKNKNSLAKGTMESYLQSYKDSHISPTSDDLRRWEKIRKTKNNAKKRLQFLEGEKSRVEELLIMTSEDESMDETEKTERLNTLTIAKANIEKRIQDLKILIRL